MTFVSQYRNSGTLSIEKIW